MKSSSIVIVADKVWNKLLSEQIEHKIGMPVYEINHQSDLTIDKITDLTSEPKFLFFTHWSQIIPETIYNRFECVVFHMSDLPFGRGGSPLQNLISRGIYETQITAIRANKVLDGGPVYLKHPLSLYGAAEEIYIRASHIMQNMILKICQYNLLPEPQEGKPVYFKRRLPKDSDIKDLDQLEQLFDYIRMLDADDYPKAFLETEHFRFEFKHALLKKEEITANVSIRIKQSENKEL